MYCLKFNQLPEMAYNNGTQHCKIQNGETMNIEQRQMAIIEKAKAQQEARLIARLETPAGERDFLVEQDKALLNSLIHQQDNLKKKFDNKQIEKAEYEALNTAIEEQIEKLGGHLAMSKAGDAILQYVQTARLSSQTANPLVRNRRLPHH